MNENMALSHDHGPAFRTASQTSFDHDYLAFRSASQTSPSTTTEAPHSLQISPFPAHLTCPTSVALETLTNIQALKPEDIRRLTPQERTKLYDSHENKKAFTPEVLATLRTAMRTDLRNQSGIDTISQQRELTAKAGRQEERRKAVRTAKAEGDFSFNIFLRNFTSNFENILAVYDIDTKQQDFGIDQDPKTLNPHQKKVYLTIIKGRAQFQELIETAKTSEFWDQLELVAGALSAKKEPIRDFLRIVLESRLCHNRIAKDGWEILRNLKSNPN